MRHSRSKHGSRIVPCDKRSFGRHVRRLLKMFTNPVTKERVSALTWTTTRTSPGTLLLVGTPGGPPLTIKALQEAISKLEAAMRTDSDNPAYITVMNIFGSYHVDLMEFDKTADSYQVTVSKQFHDKSEAKNHSESWAAELGVEVR